MEAEKQAGPVLLDEESLPANFGVIEVHVDRINRLFNSLDPSPFRERDLDPKAESFIMESGGEFHADQPLALIVHLDQLNCTADETRALRDAIHAYFAERARSTRRRLRDLFRVGRKSLIISVLFMAAVTASQGLLSQWLGKDTYFSALRESLVIAGWVALWRPLEIFLYDWWPIRAEAKLYDRLADMLVRVVQASGN